jgi:hemolysin activation/secretion protein
MAGGVLRVQILEGVIGQISAKGASADAQPLAAAELGHKSILLQNILAAQGLQPGQVLETAPLERSVLLFAERGHLQADLGLSPGAAVGSTDLGMRWQQTRPAWAAHIGLDNHSSRATGALRASADVQGFSLLAQGDDLALRASTSGWERASQGQSQHSSIGYKLPLGFDGWRIGVQASQLRYALGGAFAALQYKGAAHTGALSLSYPLHLSASTQSHLELLHHSRRAVDDSIAGNVNSKRSRTTSLIHSHSHSGEAFGKALDQRLQSAFTAGQLDLSRNPAASAFDAANASAAGHFSKLRVDYQASYALQSGQQLQARLSQQWTRHNLDSSEKASLGGSQSVRAYPVGEANGDQATLASLEWRVNINPLLGLAASFTSFIDWGRIEQNRRPWAAALASAQTSGIPNRYQLSGAGLGLALGRPGSWQASLQIAAPLGKNPAQNAQGHSSDGKPQGPRAWLSLQKSL